jgi:hypothetical protein
VGTEERQKGTGNTARVLLGPHALELLRPRRVVCGLSRWRCIMRTVVSRVVLLCSVLVLIHFLGCQKMSVSSFAI